MLRRSNATAVLTVGVSPMANIALVGETVPPAKMETSVTPSDETEDVALVNDDMALCLDRGIEFADERV